MGKQTPCVICVIGKKGGSLLAKDTLSEKEKLFCYHIASCKSIKQAAALAGYSNPLLSGLRLIVSPKIKERIEKISTTAKVLEEASCGLRQIAFGDVSDAVRLITADDISTLDIDALDLHMVSELKFAKNGGIEVKFYDRIKALEKLMEISDSTEQGNDFLQALQNSVQKDVETEA